MGVLTFPSVFTNFYNKINLLFLSVVRGEFYFQIVKILHSDLNDFFFVVTWSSYYIYMYSIHDISSRSLLLFWETFHEIRPNWIFGYWKLKVIWKFSFDEYKSYTIFSEHKNITKRVRFRKLKFFGMIKPAEDRCISDPL